MPDTILITGGAGNLAGQLTFDLAGRGDRIVLSDVVERPGAPVAAGCIYERRDLSRSDEVVALVEQYKPSVILHFASLLSGSCEKNRDLAWRLNMDGAFALFEAALKVGTQKFFFPSSLATYGGILPSPLPVDYAQWPASLYGVTKVACERLGAYYHEKHGLDFRCVRLPVVISAYAPAGAASAFASRAFVEAVENGRFTFRVNPTTRASSAYVRDVLTGMLALFDAPAKHLTRRVYNIHGLAPSAGEIAEAIEKRVPGASFNFDPDAAIVSLIESWPAQIDDVAARKDWGWKPAFDLDRLADDFIPTLRAHRGSTSPSAVSVGGNRK